MDCEALRGPFVPTLRPLPRRRPIQLNPRGQWRRRRKASSHAMPLPLRRWRRPCTCMHAAMHPPLSAHSTMIRNQNLRGVNREGSHRGRGRTADGPRTDAYAGIGRRAQGGSSDDANGGSFLPSVRDRPSTFKVSRRSTDRHRRCVATLSPCLPRE